MGITSTTATSRSRIRELAKSVHDEIYSIENTLKRRGYEYAGSGSVDKLVTPKDMSSREVDGFYKYMGSRTFRNIVKDIVDKKENILPDYYINGCSETKLSEYFDFLCSARILQYAANSSSYYLTIRIDDFGPTLEWYVSELFKRELECTADWGVRIKNLKPGGDFDVIARDESKLVWIETKSSRLEHIIETDIRHFLQRDQNLDPDISIFLVDTHNDLSCLISAFEDIMTPVVAGDSGMKDPNYHFKINQLTDFGDIYHTLRRVFIINTDPLILTNLRYCLKYYFAIVTHATYLSRSKRLDFLSKR